jgi:Zn-dependent M28 family amino/carboxypeptidase
MISREDKELVSYTGELVFVGHGAIAPEYGWDDYKGIDVKGKIVVCLDNHPEFQSPGYKPGNTTYYGHWEYKPKIAFDKGATGILIIVEDNAIFPWPLLQRDYSSASYGQNAFIAPIPVISYISENAFDKVLKHSGSSVKALAEKAANINFEPFRMHLNLRTGFIQNSDQFESPNVVGIVPGTKKPDEAVIIMAHYDHLGIGKSVNHDSIYNGTIDNASGTAALLNLASYFSEHPTYRSIIFLATTSEEMGFQGVEYYLVNSVIPNEKIICGLNMDMLNFLGRRDSIELSPVFYTDATETIRKISRKMNLDLILSDFDNEFINFRLDSWAFALYDVVTFNIVNIPIKGSYPSITTNELENIIKEGGLNYHTPFDEIKPWFKYDGILQELELARNIGEHYANDGIKPKFNKGNPFEPAKKLWIKK